MQSSATIDWWEQDWNEVMMSRLLKLSEAKQREHVHLGDVSHSAHGKYDVCTLLIMLWFFFAFLKLLFFVLCIKYCHFCYVAFTLRFVGFSAGHSLIMSCCICVNRLLFQNFSFCYSLAACFV